MNRRLSILLAALPLTAIAVWYTMPRHDRPDTPEAPAPSVADSGKKKAPRDPADAPIRLPQAKPVIKPDIRPVNSPGPVPASVTAAADAPAIREWVSAVDQKLKTGDIAGAAALLREAKKNLPPEDRALVVRQTAKALARSAATEPGKAPALLREMQDLLLQQDLANGYTLELAEKKDFTAAADFVNRVSDTTEGQPAAETLGREWSAEDRSQSIDWINTLESRLLQARASGGIAFNWAQEDMSGLIEWAQQIPDAAVQGQVYLKAVKIMAADDPAAAATWAATLPAGISRDQALGFSVSQWAAADPPAAANWALTVTGEKNYGTAILSAAAGWAESDAAAALKWSSTLPEAIRGQAVATVTGTGPEPISGEIVSPGTTPGAPFTGAPRQPENAVPGPVTPQQPPE